MENNVSKCDWYIYFKSTSSEKKMDDVLENLQIYKTLKAAQLDEAIIGSSL